jgi:hypothetical protein
MWAFRRNFWAFSGIFSRTRRELPTYVSHEFLDFNLLNLRVGYYIWKQNIIVVINLLIAPIAGAQLLLIDMNT